MSVTKNSVRHDWYQTEVAVVITVLVKNVKPDELEVNFSQTGVGVNFLMVEEKQELLFKLSHKIVPEQCNYTISPSKIEIKLKKSEGIRWEKLEGDPDVEAPKIIQQEAAAFDKPPSYPTSKGKDWNAIEREIKVEEAKEKPGGEEALNVLFQEIYGRGNDEVKKAMNKSYLESGGTVLSTNWEEISRKTVDVTPPDGMEWKKWDTN